MRLRPLRRLSTKRFIDIAIIASAMLILMTAFFLGYAVGNSDNSHPALLPPQMALALKSSANTSGNDLITANAAGSNTGSSQLTQEEQLALKTMPKHRINESQIKVYSNMVQINLKDAEWSTFTPTKSMVPFLDKGSYAIQIVPSSESDLQVGDIISYSYGNDTIIHRIIMIGNDSEGWYAIVKGDNNPSPDPFKVRFSQVKRVLVAIIY